MSESHTQKNWIIIATTSIERQRKREAQKPIVNNILLHTEHSNAISDLWAKLNTSDPASYSSLVHGVGDLIQDMFDPTVSCARVYHGTWHGACQVGAKYMAYEIRQSTSITWGMFVVPFDPDVVAEEHKITVLKQIGDIRIVEAEHKHNKFHMAIWSS